MYHDIIQDYALSGFLDPGADSYKLTRDTFIRHIDTLKMRNDKPVLITNKFFQGDHQKKTYFTLTFDDGGISCYDIIAEVLDEVGWHGHFFIPTDFINSPHFLTSQQIKNLRKRGHVIGTHTCSHSLMLSKFKFTRILKEWTDSIKKLSDILGEQIEIGSIPYCGLSKNVIKAASLSGVKILFTSQPTGNVRFCRAEDCLILGRYTITSKINDKTAAKLASGAILPHLSQNLNTKIKILTRILFGSYFPKIREFYFSMRVHE